jgi:hypothetical protein
MTTLPLKKSIGRSLRRHGFLLLSLTLVLAWLALAPAAKAQLPPPDGGAGTENTEEEDVQYLSTGMGNAAIIGTQVKDEPNHWVIKIDFEKFIMCAMEKVQFRGELHVKFEPGANGNVYVDDVRLKGRLPGKPFFAKGTGPKPLGRTYVLDDVRGRGFGRIKVGNTNGLGHGSFGRMFEFIAKPTPSLPGNQVKFTLVWAPPRGRNLEIDGKLNYEFKNGKVIHLEARPHEIECPRR